MPETQAGGTTVFSCPLSKCRWTFALPQGGMLAIAAIEAALRRARQSVNRSAPATETGEDEA